MIASWMPSAKRCRRSGRRTTSTIALLAFSMLLVACAGARKVERRQGQHVELGRRVSPTAYAWYARARYLHRLGQLELARAAYGAVLGEDPRSGSAFAGLGSSYCSSDPRKANETFSRGLRRAVETVPIYLARGRCELDWGQPELSVKSARLAFARDPSSPEASALLADALTEFGKPAEAARVRRGQKLFAGLDEVAPAAPASPAAVDLALARGDLALAETLALELMPRSTLAVRAFALGRWDFAREQASLVALAAPDDQAAWAVLALTRAEAPTPGDEAKRPPEGKAPDDLASCLWAEHLRAQAGALPAELFLDALALGDADSALQTWGLAGDPLLEACAGRLKRGRPGEVAARAPTSARL